MLEYWTSYFGRITYHLPQTASVGITVLGISLSTVVNWALALGFIVEDRLLRLINQC